MINILNCIEFVNVTFFQKKKWGRSEKMDKNKCPFFCPGMENHFSENVNFGFRA